MYWVYMRVGVQPGAKGDVEKLNEILHEGGWEPYAVTWDGAMWDHHLRSQRYYD